ncbi:hypothetical protein [Afipia carboxidovorans]|uniref:hypothetical protein n=1 Tax=Afipia carboxidovorans TaxID=40137 RepID=UPI0030873863|nr:hypothetical protein CRBSH125_09980 [Afipia carboxidovorans]
MNTELLARCRSFVDGQSCGEWGDKAINEDAAKLYEFVQREAASALRLAAQSPEPVAWVQSNYLAALEKVGLVTAYAENHRKADDVPIYAAPPQSASDGALREALHLFREFVLNNVTQWELGAGDANHPMWALVAVALDDTNKIGVTKEECWRFIQPLNRKDLAASEATKSDGGEERPASNPLSEVTHRPSDPIDDGVYTGDPRLAHRVPNPLRQVTPGPSEDLMQKFEQFKAATDERLAEHTRSADVTVDELAQLIIKTVETSAEGCSNGVWVNAHPAARALLDTYKIGAR